MPDQHESLLVALFDDQDIDVTCALCGWTHSLGTSPSLDAANDAWMVHESKMREAN